MLSRIGLVGILAVCVAAGTLVGLLSGGLGGERMEEVARSVREVRRSQAALSVGLHERGPRAEGWSEAEEEELAERLARKLRGGAGEHEEREDALVSKVLLLLEDERKRRAAFSEGLPQAVEAAVAAAVDKHAREEGRAEESLAARVLDRLHEAISEHKRAMRAALRGETRLLSPPQRDPAGILIAIPSHHLRKGERMRIRNTWLANFTTFSVDDAGKLKQQKQQKQKRIGPFKREDGEEEREEEEEEKQSGSGIIGDFGIAYRFFLANRNATGVEENEELLREEREHGDLVFLEDLERERYEGLPEKVSAMMRWAVANTRATWIVKTDSDVYLNVPLLRKLALDFSPRLFYAGSLILGMPVIRKEGHRNAERHLKVGEFPPYASGVTYVVSADAADAISSPLLPPLKFTNEDAMVGYFLSWYNVTSVHIPQILPWGISAGKCVPADRILSLHSIPLDRFVELHETIVAGEPVCF